MATRNNASGSRGRCGRSSHRKQWRLCLAGKVHGPCRCSRVRVAADVEYPHLLSSSATVHVAHTAILADNRKKWSYGWYHGGLGANFLVLQAVEYYEAYALYGLTLNSGIYGSTFFMLTGFHGFHIAMGMTMLLIQLVRSVRRKHFTATDHFGFEASSRVLYPDVWVFLFLFVYIL